MVCLALDYVLLKMGAVQVIIIDTDGLFLKKIWLGVKLWICGSKHVG